MASSKPMGMQKKEYFEAQKVKEEEEFKFNISQKLQNLQFAIDMTNQVLAQSIANQDATKKDCDIQFSNFMTAIKTSLKEFRETIDQLELMVEANKSLTNQLIESQKGHVTNSEFQEQISNLNECIRRLNADRESIRKDLNGMMNRFSQDFDNRLKALKEEILAIPSEIPGLKKMFDQKFELVELNGQNSLLRSANNEKQLMLVERKIDNIYQLIKKLELITQESK